MKMILIVLFLFAGLYAAKTSSSQSVADEIGVPYVEKGIAQIDSAVLAPDGKSFYTLKDGLVTQWQLSPVKRLSSFRVSRMHHYDGHQYHLSVSNDNKRIILYSHKEIQLWDLESTRHLKTVKENLQLATPSKYGFLVLTRKNYLHIWDESDLSLSKNIEIKHEPLYSNYTYANNMISGDNILLINYIASGFFYDLDKFKVIESFSNVTVDYSNDLPTLMDNETKEMFLNKYKEKFKPYLFKHYMKSISHRTSDPIIMSSLSLSNIVDGQENQELILVKDPVSGAGLFLKYFLNKEKKSKRKKYYFYQFDDDWCLIESGKGFFTSSKNIRKFLKMKTVNGEIIPINSVTFKKYYKQINLKD